jgi:hypothetical protein
MAVEIEREYSSVAGYWSRLEDRIEQMAGPGHPVDVCSSSTTMGQPPPAASTQTGARLQIEKEGPP